MWFLKTLFGRKTKWQWLQVCDEANHLWAFPRMPSLIIALLPCSKNQLIVSQPIRREGGHCDTHPFCIAIANCDTPPLHCSDRRFASQSNYQISILILDCNYFIALVCGLWGHWLNLRIIYPILQLFQKSPLPASEWAVGCRHTEESVTQG